MATYYFRNTGDVNWGTATNWSLTDGGGATGAVPTAADDALFTANSGNCTVNASARVCKTLNFTGYTNTITMTFGIIVSGSVTLVAAMTIAGASGLTINATGTFTSNGKTWPNALTFSATNTTTLADDLSVSGLITISGATTVNGSFNINANGGLSATSSLLQGTGTTTLNINGGTLSQTNSTGIQINTTNINGNVTIGTTLWMHSPNFNYVSGNVITSGSNLINQIVTTLNWNLNGIIWDTITFNSPITLLSDLYCNDFIKQGTSNRTLNGFSLYISGNLNLSSGGATSGTTNIILNGNGSITNSALTNNLKIDTLGIIKIIGNLSYNTGTLNLQNGKVIANNATLSLTNNAIIINIDKINFKTITITAGTTQTMNKFFSGSALVPTRIQSTGANYTIAFQDGFEKITKFTKISNCTVTNRGQLLCITDKSNKGGNVGIRYINQSPNGVAKNAPTSPNPMAYGLPSFLDSDPNFIIN